MAELSKNDYIKYIIEFYTSLVSENAADSGTRGEEAGAD